MQGVVFELEGQLLRFIMFSCGNLSSQSPSPLTPEQEAEAGADKWISYDTSLNRSNSLIVVSWGSIVCLLYHRTTCTSTPNKQNLKRSDKPDDIPPRQGPHAHRYTLPSFSLYHKTAFPSRLFFRPARPQIPNQSSESKLGALEPPASFANLALQAAVLSRSCTSAMAAVVDTDCWRPLADLEICSLLTWVASPLAAKGDSCTEDIKSVHGVDTHPASDEYSQSNIHGNIDYQLRTTTASKLSSVCSDVARDVCWLTFSSGLTHRLIFTSQSTLRMTADSLWEYKFSVSINVCAKAGFDVGRKGNAPLVGRRPA